jgi:hypothetical protein
MACIEGYLAATYEVYIGWDTEACYVCHGILTKYIKWLRAHILSTPRLLM